MIKIHFFHLHDSQSVIKLLIVAGIILLTFCSYYPAIHSDYIWDDDNYVTDNYTLKSLQGLKDIWTKPGAVPQYYPAVHTTFWLEYHFWKLNPLGYHLVNITIHIASAILVALVLHKIAIPGAWLAALIFAIHPVHVESVAWITERKNVLSAFFYLSSLIVFQRLIIKRDCRHRPNPSSRYFEYSFAFLLYLCALLSKTVTCTLPVVILVIHWLQRKQITRRVVLSLIPFFVIGLALGLVTIYLEKYRVGARGTEWELSFLERCIIAGRALWFYFGKIAWPENLTFIYPRWEIKQNLEYNILFPLSFLGLLALLFVYRFRLGRGALAAFLIFGISLFPALGFFDVYPMRYSFVADHFQYLASIPIISLLTSFMLNTFQTIKSSNWSKGTLELPNRLYCYIQSTVIVVLLGILSFLTWNRCLAFQNAETLWLDTLAKNPNAWMAHNNLGLLYVEKNLAKKAIFHFEQAITLKPDHAQAYNNLAMELEKTGNDALAKTYFHQALQLEPNNIFILNNCGNFFARQGKLDHAGLLYNHALKLNASASITLINLGNLYVQMQHYEKAVSNYSKALSMDPDQADAHFNLANVLSLQKKPQEAIIHYQLALASRPNFVEAKAKLKELSLFSEVSPD